MQGRIIVGLGIGLVVAASCWLVPSKVLALTDEEIIRALDERVATGEISEELYRKLRKKYAGGESAPKPQAKPVKEVKGNLLKNFSMEEDNDGDMTPDNWQVTGVRYGDFVITDLDSQVRHGGDKSIRVQFYKSNSNSCKISQVIKVEPGKKYLFSCWLKGENLRGKDGCLLQAFASPTKPGEKDRGTVVADLPLWGKATGSFDWRRIPVTTKPLPAKAQYLKVWIRFHMGIPNSKAWIDDVVLIAVD